MIYQKIYEFCRQKNKGNCFKNGNKLTPRVIYLIKLLESLNIKYELDVFKIDSPVNKSYKIDDNNNVIQEEGKEEEVFKTKDNTKEMQKRLKDLEREYYKLRDENKKLYMEIRDRLLDDNNKDGKDTLTTSLKERRKKIIKKMSELSIEGDKLYRKINGSFFGTHDREKYKKENYFYNIILKGTSNKMVVAHHDIVNPNSDNANDNSCSVINAIALKKLKPEINVCLLDGEEVGGIGSKRVSDQINAGYFGKIKWVLNFELTGKGGKNFFIGNYPGELFNLIVQKFDPPITQTPFNDSVIFRENGIDSCVINPLPPKKVEKEESGRFNGGSGYNIITKDGVVLDHSLLFNCHSTEDSLSTISPEDMKEFVEEVAIKIVS